MANVNEDFDQLAAANSELRFITLELMKIGAKQGKSFNVVLKEFLTNAHKLKRTVSSASTKQR